MSKPVVFVSYSHKDEVEKEQLVSQLRVWESAGVIELWVDDRIEGGADWEQEIEQAIARASAAILLISANFLTSKFILGEEVPAFLKRRQSEGLTVFPVIAKPCAWDAFEWLQKMNVRPKNARVIWSGTPSQIEVDLDAIAKEVVNIVKKKGSAPLPPMAGSTPGGTATAQPLSSPASLGGNEPDPIIATKIRRLYELQKKAALYGLSTPPEVAIEIEDLKAEIAELKRQHG